MNQRPDIDRVLQVWMTDGPTAIPDRVVDAVAARIGVQRQRRTWPFPGRTTVNTQIKLIAALAAAIVVAVVGYNLLPKGPSVGNPSGQPSTMATATPTATAAASPSTAVSCPAWYTNGCAEGAGTLAPGSHTTKDFFPAFTLTVPEVWINDLDVSAFYGLFPDTPANQAEFARTGNTHGLLIASSLPSPYFYCETWEDNRGATAAEMVAALTANEALLVTGVVDVTIGGLTGKQFDARLNPDWTETCPGDPPGLDLKAPRTRGFFLDIPGRIPLVIWGETSRPEDFEAFLADAMPVVESFEFDLGS